MTQEPFFTTLKPRAILKISGTDGKSFLQGLITNDINLLNTQPCLYSCLLSPQGKFMFDFFISQENEALILDCEPSERAIDLKKMLSMYALRANVTFELHDDITVYIGIGENNGFPDPRHPEIGFRSFEKPQNLPEQPFETWDKLRIKLCIPDGSRDMIPGKSTLLESNIDKLNGISFTKGCYVGQELTARMHYRGLAKKHLKTVTLDDLGLKTFPAPFENIIKDEKIIGEMRSSCGNIGIALLKDNS